MKQTILFSVKATIGVMALASSLAFAGGGSSPVLAGGVGAAAGAVIGQSVGGTNGAILGGAIGGATGVAIGSHGSHGNRGNSAVVGGAVGGAAGVLVGQAVGGPTGAVLGAAAGGAIGSTMGGNSRDGHGYVNHRPDYRDHHDHYRPVVYQRIEPHREMWVPPGHRWDHGRRDDDHDRGRRRGHSRHH